MLPPLLLVALIGPAVAARGACGYDGRCPDWQRTDAGAPSVNDAVAALGGRLVVDAGVAGSTPTLVAYYSQTGHRSWSSSVTRPGSQAGQLDGVATYRDLIVATGSWDGGTVASSGYPIGATMTAAFDARSGSMLWQREVRTSGGLDDGSRVVFSPDGTVVYSVGIVGEKSSHAHPGKWRVIAYRASTGRELWRWSAAGSGLHQSVAGAVLSRDGSVLVLAGEDHNGRDPDWLVGGLDTRTHRLLWTDRRNVGNDVPTKIVAAPDGSSAYVVGVSEPLSSTTTILTAPPVQLQTIAYSMASGHVRWVNRQNSNSESFWASDATADPRGGLCIAGWVYEETLPGPTLPYVICIDAHGRQRWEQRPQLSGLPSHVSEYGAIAIHPRSGTIVVGGYDVPDTHGTTQDAIVRGLALSSGRQLWESRRSGYYSSYSTAFRKIVVTPEAAVALGTWTPPTSGPLDSPSGADTMAAGFTRL